MALDHWHLPIVLPSASTQPICKSLLLHGLRGKAGKSCLTGTAIAYSKAGKGNCSMRIEDAAYSAGKAFLTAMRREGATFVAGDRLTKVIVEEVNN